MAKAMITDVKVSTGERKDGKGTWTRYAVKDGNGEYASTFDKKLGEFLVANRGKFVDLATNDGERGRDVVNATPWVEPAEKAAEERGQSINRAVALKAAVAYVGVTGVSGDRGVLEVADMFVAWLANEPEEGPPPPDDETPF